MILIARRQFVLRIHQLDDLRVVIEPGKPFTVTEKHGEQILRHSPIICDKVPLSPLDLFMAKL